MGIIPLVFQTDRGHQNDFGTCPFPYPSDTSFNAFFKPLWSISTKGIVETKPLKDTVRIVGQDILLHPVQPAI